MRLVRVRWWMKWLYPGVEWHYPSAERTIYITFDDGPVPEVTPRVLEILRNYGVKATFFAIGDNVRKYPELFQQILHEGHRIGNHSYRHYNAWKVSADVYLQDVEEAAKYIPSALFRPPYGKLTWRILFALRKKYRIVMWEVISCDFDGRVTAAQVYRNVVEQSRPGAVIVFHDSLKAAPRMLAVLPMVLEHFQKQQYRFRVIP